MQPRGKTRGVDYLVQPSGRGDYQQVQLQVATKVRGVRRVQASKQPV